jgi:hypothetical protein
MAGLPTIVPTRVQEVANPGRSHAVAIAEARNSSALKQEVEKLASRVAKLERKLASSQPSDADTSEAPDLDELVASLQALTEAASGATGAQSSAAIGAGIARPPATRAYRSLNDAASVVSWSADAYGRSKTPGWYHTTRKQMYQMRAERAAAEPTGCYVSHSKFADEAKRIQDTGRRAFASGKYAEKPAVKPLAAKATGS